MMKGLKHIHASVLLLFAMLAWSSGAVARDVIDSLYSAGKDRVIVSYSIKQSGSNVTVKFNSVKKKLNDRNADKYRNLEEVKVVIFDRTGNYRDTKFEGKEPKTFLVPSEITYERSAEGYFFLDDSPELKYTSEDSEAQLDVPIFLAHYEKKHKYKVIEQCGTLVLKTKATNGGGGGGGDDEEIISTDELIDDGLAPADEAAIRIELLQKMLAKVKKVPFSEELTDEARALRDLRMKLNSDPDMVKQINDALDAYDAKKEELEEKAQADIAAKEQADADAAAKAQQELLARTDSINAANLMQQAKEKKELLIYAGIVVGIILLFLLIKQILKMVKEHKQQKKQEELMQKLQQMSNPTPAPATEKPKDPEPPKQPEQPQQPQQPEQPAETEQPGKRKLSPEMQAAKERMEELKRLRADGKSPADGGNRITPGKHGPSLNDQIPPQYRRWRKPGSGSGTPTN